MKLAKIRQLREMADRMNKMPSSSSSGYQQLRYEILPREIIPAIIVGNVCIAFYHESKP